MNFYCLIKKAGKNEDLVKIIDIYEDFSKKYEK